MFIQEANENFDKELDQWRRENSGEDVPHQYVSKIRRYEERIYNVTLAASNIGEYSIYRNIKDITEIETNIFEYRGSLFDALRSRYPAPVWQTRSNLQDASPNSMTVYNNKSLEGPTRQNRILKLTNDNISYESIVVKMVNIREITDE